MNSIATKAEETDFPWTADEGNGHYRNPILFADYSDPDVIRVGHDFWLTASSFNCTPGLPILTSNDLVNWTIVGHAIKKVPDPRYQSVQPGAGVWAPSIRFHANKFWIFFPTPDEGIYVTTADHPRAEWTEPHLLQAGKGLIDPCPLWDDDGRAYLVYAYAGSRAGIKDRLDIREMDPAAARLIGPPRTIFNDPANHPTAEGPKFYKRNDWYYIFAPAGGVTSGWQLVLRSRHVYGPYEHRIVLAQGSTSINGPHQGALVDTMEGDDWFVHFQERQPYGRIVHLQPVTWRDSWPIIGEASDRLGIGQPVRAYPKPVSGESPTSPATTDLFRHSILGKQWQWHANHEDAWFSLTDRPGWLRLNAMPLNANELSLTPHLLLQKFPAPRFRVETRVHLTTLNSSGGIVVIGNQSAAWMLHRSEHACSIRLRIGNVDSLIAECSQDTVELCTIVLEGGDCTFCYRGDAGWIFAPKHFKAREGMWIGAKIGLAAGASDSESAKFADFNYFQFGPARA